MDINEEILLVGTMGRKILVWDLRNMNEPFQQRDSLLKYQTRCLRVFPNKKVSNIINYAVDLFETFSAHYSLQNCLLLH